TMTAVAPDGSGDFYLGGTFTSVRGQARNNLAQLDAGGNLTNSDGSCGSSRIAPSASAATRTLCLIFSATSRRAMAPSASSHSWNAGSCVQRPEGRPVNAVRPRDGGDTLPGRQHFDGLLL